MRQFSSFDIFFRPTPVRLFMCAGLLVVFAFRVQDGGFLDIESQAFVSNYLADRPIAEKVFDVSRNDWGCYQARELSYLVDAADAFLLRVSSRLGLVHFLSVVHYIILASILLLHFKLASRAFPGHSRTVLLLLLGYATSPSSLFASFFRTSKILVAGLLVPILWMTFVPGMRSRRTATSNGLLFLLALTMTLVDRQGFFFAAALVLVCGLQYGFTRERAWIVTGGIFFASVALNVVYNLHVGPWLIQATNGYSPDFSFQNLGFLTSLDGISFRTFLGRCLRSLTLLPSAAGYLFGNIGIAGGVVLLCLGGYSLFRRPGFAADGRGVLGRLHAYRYLILYLFVVALLSMMALILVLRAPYLLWVEHRLVYYLIPVQAILLFGATLIVVRVVNDTGRARLAHLVLFAAFCLNICSAASHYATYTSPKSHFRESSRIAPVLRDCVRLRKRPVESFGLTTRLQEACRSLR